MLSRRGESAVARVVRRHSQALPWIRAMMMTVGTATALGVMSFDPSVLGYLLAVGTGVLMLVSPVAAVLTSLVIMTNPLAASSLLVGAVFLIAGVLAIQFLARDGAGVFLVILMSLVCVLFGPAWAAAVLAGYLLGATTGAVAAVVACVVILLGGLLTGNSSVGVLVTGGLPPAFLSFDSAAQPLTAWVGWVTGGVQSVPEDAAALVDTYMRSGDVPLMVLQPLFWGAGAAVAGSLRCTPSTQHRLVKGAIAVAAGTAVVAVSSLIAVSLLASVRPSGSMILASVGSLAVALAVVALSEMVFTPVVVRPSTLSGTSTMRTEDAEVDELLRLISTAEEALSTKHTTEAVVMITDMKSFSAMTEEEGSFTSAKLVQRHRDLLLPVISAQKGSGKSTGGDGLVAAFATPKQAVRAAIEMQHVLERYNRSHADERDIWVRIGIASGEVVLDSGGRPFIGTALNLAARVMNLGDGGCIMVTRPVADAAKQPTFCLHSHGEFTLKNIAEPVEVIEVLWSDDRTPCPPACS
jgi:class 3 adenylate cyclase